MSDFFPPVGERFTVVTDDREVFACARAQDYGKAIHTPSDNSQFGRYFRARIGVDEGARVRGDDLRRYGRTDVDFIKLDNETYHMDFLPR